MGVLSWFWCPKLVLRIAVISIENREGCCCAKKWRFFRAPPPCQETLFASAGSARAQEKIGLFVSRWHRFIQRNADRA